MLQVTEDDLENARLLIATGTQQAVGYRLVIKPIEAGKGLEKAEQAAYSHLAQSGFEVKTDNQADKESKGSQYGIVLSIGPGAYTAPGLGDAPKEGEVVIFERYAGIEMEFPPGSGNMCRIMNDESLIAKMESK